MEGEGCGLFCSEVPLFESNVSTILSLMTSIYDYTGLPSLQNLQCDADQVHNKTTLPSDLRTVAAKKGFLVSDNQASGNCLFYALSEQLKSVKGIQISHKELRNTLVQFLKENANQVRRLNFIMLRKKMAEAFSVSYKIQDCKANLKT